MLNFLKSRIQNEEQNRVGLFLCDQVKQFGFCKNPCTERHVLSKTLDKDCLNIPIKCFISIQLTQIVSASHFYGRILKYSTSKDPKRDQDWTVYEDSFQRIKYELNNFCSTSNTKIVCTNLVVGEMVMVETERKEYFRAIILDIVHGWFSVKVKAKLIDLGHVEELPSNKVFVLPSHLKQFRPAAVEVIISSIEPFSKGSDTILNWPATTTNYVRYLFEPMMLINQEFVCKVVLILGTTLWVDWLLVKKCIKRTHFACKLYKNDLMLSSELIDRNLAQDNSSLINRLINLDKDVHLWDVHLNVDESKNKLYKKPNAQLLSSDDIKINTDQEIQPQWAHLSNDTLHSVSVVYVEDPTCILVINLKFIDRVSVLQKDIDKAVSNNIVKHLTCATVGTLCLAISPEDNNYNRVVIKKIDDLFAEILYVDYGGIYKVNVNSLMTIPTHLITNLPFQIIECKLSGYKQILDADIGNQFANNLIQLVNTSMSLKVITSFSKTKVTGGNVYEIVLFNNDTNINTAMANDYNVYVDNTQIQHILKSNYEYKELKCSNINEDELSKEDLQNQFDLLKSFLNIPEENNKTPIEESNSTKSIGIDETKPDLININENKTKKKSIEKAKNLIQPDSINVSHDLVTNNINNKLKKYCSDCCTTPVVPQCFWHQDEQWIYLKLKILAVNSFEVHHTMNSITLEAKTNSVSYFFTAVLFASIMKESFNCQVTFDSIQIKAQKLLQINYQWPRLMKCSKKHRFIIYDTEYVFERKNMDFFATMVNKYKLMACGYPIKSVNYNSDCHDSDSDDLEESKACFED